MNPSLASAYLTRVIMYFPQSDIKFTKASMDLPEATL